MSANLAVSIKRGEKALAAVQAVSALGASAIAINAVYQHSESKKGK